MSLARTEPVRHSEPGLHKLLAMLGAAAALASALHALPTMAQVPTPTPIAPKVVGYIPAYKPDMPGAVGRIDLRQLTHLNIAFLNPGSDGSLMQGGQPVCMGAAQASDLRQVVKKAHQAGVKVLVSLAGGVIPACSGHWQTLLQPGTRPQLVKNLLRFAKQFQLDGIDVDLEGELLTAIDKAGNYTPFVQALRQGLKGKLLTAATATYEGGMVPVSSLPHFDFVTLMAYDALGPSWGTVGDEHAPYAMAQSHMATWKASGLPREKIVLGLPFYGYGFNGYAQDFDFSAIVAQFGAAAAQADVVGTRCASCAYVSYNGIPTIRAKTRLALQHGAGVMVWELTQDAGGANSLLGAIRAEIAGF